MQRTSPVRDIIVYIHRFILVSDRSCFSVEVYSLWEKPPAVFHIFLDASERTVTFLQQALFYIECGFKIQIVITTFTDRCELLQTIGFSPQTFVKVVRTHLLKCASPLSWSRDAKCCKCQRICENVTSRHSALKAELSTDLKGQTRPRSDAQPTPPLTVAVMLQLRHTQTSELKT